MVLIMFLLPARRVSGRTEYMMDWPTAQRLPWGILLLIGSGFAIASAFGTTGLSESVGHSLGRLLHSRPTWIVVAGICMAMTFLTEFTSNVATVNALMPILAAASVSIGVDPRLIMIPATLSASCAFMLPIATPPNAIVFASGRIPMRRMIQYGFVMNLFGVIVITLGALFLMRPLMDIEAQGLPNFVPSANSGHTDG